MTSIVGGKIQVSVNGGRIDAKGEFTINPGRDMREAVIGADRPHGAKVTPQAPSIEGAMTVRDTTDVDAILDAVDATVVVELANGRTFVLRDAWFAGSGELKTGESELAVKFEGLSGEWI
jgi:hypothetical protein